MQEGLESGTTTIAWLLQRVGETLTLLLFFPLLSLLCGMLGSQERVDMAELPKGTLGMSRGAV